MNKQKMNEVFISKQRKTEQIYRANIPKDILNPQAIQAWIHLEQEIKELLF